MLKIPKKTTDSSLSSNQTTLKNNLFVNLIMLEKSINWLKKENNWLILLVFLLLIGIKIYYLTLTYNQPVWWDEADYMNQGKAWAFGSPAWEMDIVRPVFFPFILGILFKIGIKELGIRIIEFLFSIAAIIFLYKLGKEMYNKYIGVSAALILGIFGSFTFFTYRILVDIPLVSLWLISTYFFWKGYKTNSKKYILLTGPLIALTFLMKFNGALLGICILIFFILADRKQLKNKLWWRSAAYCLITLIPFFIYEQVKFGNPFAFYIQAILHKGGVVQQSLWENIKDFSQIFPLLHLVYFFLFIGGLILLLKTFLVIDQIIKNEKKEYNKDFFLLIWLVFPFLYHANLGHLGYIEERYLLMVFAAASLIASLGLFWVYNQILKYHKKIAIAVIILILLIGSYQNLKQTDETIKSKKDSFKQVQLAGNWVKENTNPDDIIYSLTTQAEMQYNSERKVKGVPGEKPEELLKKLKEDKVKYVFMNVFVNLGPTDIWKVTYPFQRQDLFLPVQAYGPYIDQDEQIPIGVLYKIDQSKL